jgi:SAM-dependent methyltransferase
MSQNEQEQKYTKMQKDWYEFNASCSQYSNGVSIRDQIVGNFTSHEQFPYEEWLFKYYSPNNSHICFEYGCGPGRQIRRMQKYFYRVDGVDISESNIKNAKEYIGPGYNGILVVNDGVNIPLTDLYDYCYSIICLQHIPAYTIRRQILENMYNKLKKDGHVCVQLAFGPSMTNTPTFGYKDNFYDATATNGRCDCRVDLREEVIDDFQSIGFNNIKTELSNTVVDHHPCWIWVYGTK